MTPTINSLSGRLLLASALLLPLFLGATGLYLERAHRLSVEAAEQERLALLVLTLLAEAEYYDELWLPEQLLEGRFNQAQSGLYGMVTNGEGDVMWRSPSSLAIRLGEYSAQLPPLAPGEREFARGDAMFRLSYQVLWETEEGREIPLRFTVLHTSAPVDAEIRVYRRSLLAWLGGSAALLLLGQGAILAWGLRPLQTLSRDLGRIESGSSDHLTGAYPRELQNVTDNLNTLLASEQARRDKVRNTLADLAHSLKTPLAVVRSADPTADSYPQLVNQQTARMDEIVSYQLQRATGGSHKLLQTVPVAGVVSRLQSSLHKVYADRDLDFELAIDPDCAFRGDERDLLEILGNLMDNACKYGRRRVRVSARGSDGNALEISVEDDGDGISADVAEAITRRGIRADSRQGGQGIGLAVVAEIVSSYGGKLLVEDSDLGGARLRIELP